ncbi:helix-turn-helix transcriptional regulator [Oscillospiraceae bacterium 21-37]
MLIPKIEEIQRRREEAGLSRCQLSQAAGLPKNALSRIEYRQTNLSGSGENKKQYAEVIIRNF